MRFRHSDGTAVHVAYCTNVHPAEDVEGVLRQLVRYGGAVRRGLGTSRLGVGLWLPAQAAHALAEDAGQRARVRRVLAAEGLEVVTLNAFPYAHFQTRVVKKAVYQPDWTDRARLEYTLDAAAVLADLMPDDVVRGSVSTLPLGWREPWGPAESAAARVHLAELEAGLELLEQRTGRVVRVAFEPEPGCVVETTEDAARHLAGVDPERLGVCVDTCHLATAFEEPAEAVGRLGAAGLPVVKAQVSAALVAAEPSSRRTRSALGGFVEERFLHQVREEGLSDTRVTDDLDQALAPGSPLPAVAPWRVHFHVPLHAAPEPPLASSTDHLDDALRVLVGGDRPLTDHLEVETYTWSVLPEGARPTDDDSLVDGLVGELAWLRGRLEALGLRPDDLTDLADLTDRPAGQVDLRAAEPARTTTVEVR